MQGISSNNYSKFLEGGFKSVSTRPTKTTITMTMKIKLILIVIIIIMAIKIYW